jgi:hypothetical protein
MTTTPLGPQLIGETEKTLNALLRRFLDGTGLSEPQWVTLRLAGLLDGTVDGEGLAAAAVDRAHFSDGAELVSGLTDRKLLSGGRLTAAGRDMVAGVQARIETGAAPIWDDLPAGDVAAATRVLNEILARAPTALR